jgi:hypothetical protein
MIGENTDTVASVQNAEPLVLDLVIHFKEFTHNPKR